MRLVHRFDFGSCRDLWEHGRLEANSITFDGGGQHVASQCLDLLSATQVLLLRFSDLILGSYRALVFHLSNCEKRLP